MRRLIGFATAALGGAIGWAGYALMDPVKAGLKTLPSPIELLPFDRMFWALALMLLAVALLLKALPHPFWTKASRRPLSPPRD